MSEFTEALELLSKTTKDCTTKEQQEADLEAYFSNYLAARLDRPELAIEDLVIIYLDLRDWIKTLEDALKQEEEELTLQQVLAFGNEISESRKKFFMIKEAIWYLDKNKLGFLDGGRVDDCKEITHQFAIVRRDDVPFCKIIKGEQIYDEVVPAGPEYYKWETRPKNVFQLAATNSSYESDVMRSPRYKKGQDTNNLPTCTLEQGPNIKYLLNLLWQNEAKMHKQGKIKNNEPGFMDVMLLHKITGAQRTKEGKLIKPAHQVHDKLFETLLYMENQGFIRIIQEGKNYFAAPLISRLQYNLDRVVIDDFHLKSDRDVYLPIKYKYRGGMYPRVGIVMNGVMPRMYYDEWNPAVNERWHKEDDGRGIKETLMEGGIHFRDSCQLSPDMGTDYDRRKKYSYNPSWGKLFRNIMLARIKNGSVKTCIKVEDDLKTMKKLKLSTSSTEPDDRPKKRVSQAYYQFPLTLDDVKDLNPQRKRIAVFTQMSIEDEELMNAGLPPRSQAISIDIIDDRYIKFVYSMAIQAKDMDALVDNVKGIKSVLSANWLLPTVLLYTDINKKPFYERRISQ